MDNFELCKYSFILWNEFFTKYYHFVTLSFLDEHPPWRKPLKKCVTLVTEPPFLMMSTSNGEGREIPIRVTSNSFEDDALHGWTIHQSSALEEVRDTPNGFMSSNNVYFDRWGTWYPIVITSNFFKDNTLHGWTIYHGGSRGRGVWHPNGITFSKDVYFEWWSTWHLYRGHLCFLRRCYFSWMSHLLGRKPLKRYMTSQWATFSKDVYFEWWGTRVTYDSFEDDTFFMNKPSTMKKAPDEESQASCKDSINGAIKWETNKKPWTLENIIVVFSS